MMDFLRFIFANELVFAFTAILIWIVLSGIAKIVKAWRG